MVTSTQVRDASRVARFRLADAGAASRLTKVRPVDLKRTCRMLIQRSGARLAFVWGADERDRGGGFVVRYLFSLPDETRYAGFRLEIAPDTSRFASIAPGVPAAARFEQEIHDLLGLMPLGHPSARRLVLPDDWPTDDCPLRYDHQREKRRGDPTLPFPLELTEAEGLHEITLGPIHASAPGSFLLRAHAVDDTVVHLETRLAFGHRGIEKAFETLSPQAAVCLAESVAGDNAFAHSLAFCEAVERLAGLTVSRRAAAVRTVLAEIERVACHLGDIGRLAAAVAFGVGAALGSQLREEVLKLAGAAVGHRHLRHVNVIGGVTRDLDFGSGAVLRERLEAVERDLVDLAAILHDAPSVLTRLERVGGLAGGDAMALAAVGPTARASGVDLDTRRDHPYGFYDRLFFTVPTYEGGDVMARLRIRLDEIGQSLSMIRQVLDDPPPGSLRIAFDGVPIDSLGYAAVETPRGELLYCVHTGEGNRIVRCAIRSPSFVNWPAVSIAARGSLIEDLPLIERSFGLSVSEVDR